MKKNLIVVRKNANLYGVQYEGGGQLPGCLTGTYTKKVYAQKDIDKFINSRPKVEKDAKVKTSKRNSKQSVKRDSNGVKSSNVST